MQNSTRWCAVQQSLDAVLCLLLLLAEQLSCVPLYAAVA